MLEEAVKYFQKGFSVIPVEKNTKKPIEDWKKFQEQSADENQIREWWAKYPEANIGIITGVVSGIVVVDVEAGGDTTSLPPTVMSKTGGGGYHFFYKHPGNKVKNLVRVKDKTDIRGDGGLAVAPPSIHSSGNTYEWIISPDDAEFEELPAWVLEKCTEKPGQKTDWANFLNKESLTGSRNNNAIKLAGKLVYHLPPELWELSGWPTLREWNIANCKPPLEENELRSVFYSASKLEMARRESYSSKKQRTTSSETLLDIIKTSEVVLFRDQFEAPYVRVTSSNRTITYRCSSKQFKQWLSKQYWEKLGKVPNTEALATTLNIISAMAIEREQAHLHNRVGYYDDALWYDLTNSNWQAIKVTSSDWEITHTPPIIFRRHNHQKPQVIPDKQGDILKLLQFINISDPQHTILFLVYLISCFFPGIPHPIPVLHGTQGSAKTTFFKILRKIVDPSSLQVLTFPSNINDLVQQLSHHWMALYDNVTKLPEWLSDTLCRAVTGEGFSKRELYTDDEDVIYSFQVCVGLNGINIPAQKADLLDRSIIFTLERINPENRKDEKTFWSNFEQDLPVILGGIFNVISKTLATLPTIQISKLYRMADFTKLGCAIALALGYEQDDFLSAYEENIGMQNAEALKESPVASAIMVFMEDKAEWEGFSSHLLGELETIAQNEKIDIRSRDWPKAANSLSRRLNEAKANLSEAGIIFSYSKAGKRTLSLRKVSKITDPTVLSGSKQQANDKNAINDNSTMLSNSSIQDEVDPVLLAQKYLDPASIEVEKKDEDNHDQV